MTKGRGYVDIVEPCNAVVDIVLNLSEEDSGIFKDRHGQTIEW